MNDSQVLFWVLILSVIFYFYVDVRLSKLREETRFHYTLIENVLKNMIQNSNAPISNSWQSSNKGKVVEEWVPPPHPSRDAGIRSSCQSEQALFIDDFVPSREELIAASMQQQSKNVLPCSPQRSVKSEQPTSFMTGVEDASFVYTGALSYAPISF